MGDKKGIVISTRITSQQRKLVCHKLATSIVLPLIVWVFCLFFYSKLNPIPHMINSSEWTARGEFLLKYQSFWMLIHGFCSKWFCSASSFAIHESFTCVLAPLAWWCIVCRHLTKNSAQAGNAQCNSFVVNVCKMSRTPVPCHLNFSLACAENRVTIMFREQCCMPKVIWNQAP